MDTAPRPFRQPFFAILLFVTLIVSAAMAQKPSIASSPLAKTNGSPQYGVLTINNLPTWVRYDGHSNHTPAGHNGVKYPAGTGTLVYQDCLMFGGRAYTDAALLVPAPRQLIRVGGGDYSLSTRAGRIIDPSQGPMTGSGVEDQSAADVRVYRVRRDYAVMTDDELRRDAAAVYEVTAASVTTGQMEAVRAQYAADWIAWPVQKGAPYIERNGVSGYQFPGSLDPSFTAESLVVGHYDEPGIAGANPNAPADQVLWLVYNDLNPTMSMSFRGSEPLGLEIQRTTWGYKRTDALGQVTFSRYRIINKGGVSIGESVVPAYRAFWIDSMYVAQWSDTDIGGAGDDLLGCDTSQGLVYAYNADGSDSEFQSFQLPPASVGYDLLAGPIVGAAADSGVFDMKRRPNSRNLGLAAFVYYGAGTPWVDPPSGAANYSAGTGQTWKMLKGYTPVGDLTTGEVPFPRPPGTPLSAMPLTGDPLSMTGWLDGQSTIYSFPGGDRKFLASTGPFRMSPGDTQEVHFAIVAGLGADRLTSVSIMRANDRAAQSAFDQLFSAPNVSSLRSITHPTATTTDVAVVISSPPGTTVQTAEVIFEPETGSESPFSLQLYDDGAHTDSLAGDGIWGNVLTIANRKYPYRARLSLQTSTGAGTDGAFASNLSFRPRPVLGPWRVVWEDGQQDGKLNPDEAAFVRFDVRNADGVHSISNLSISRVGALTPGLGSEVTPSVPMSAGGIDTAESNVLWVRGTSDGSPAMLRASVVFDAASVEELVEIPVEPWSPGESWRDTLIVEAVKGPVGNVTAIVADPARRTGHDYSVDFGPAPANADGLGWWLVDIATGDTALSAQPLWNGEPLWRHPVVDGIQIRVRRVLPAFRDFQQISDGAGPLVPPHFASFGYAGMPTTLAPQDRPSLDAGGGRWGIICPVLTNTAAYFFFVDTVTARGAFWPKIVGRDWEIRFTSGPNYACAPQALTGVASTLLTVPFELWSIGGTLDDPADDVRLFPYIVDAGGDGMFNLRPVDNLISGADNDPQSDAVFWAMPANDAPGHAGYDAIVAALQSNVVGHIYLDPALMSGLVMRQMVLVLFNGGIVTDPTFPANLATQMPSLGSTFRILTTRPQAPGDRVIIRAATTGIGDDRSVPDQFALLQNYPNPFNPETIIEYQLPRRAMVLIELFDLLGRKVSTLVNEAREAGVHRVSWNGRSSNGNALSTGVYLYRLTAGGVSVTRRMVLMK